MTTNETSLSPSNEARAAAKFLTSFYDSVTPAIRSVMSIRTETVEHVLTALLAGGHILFEDVPGTGKTKLSRTIAAALGGDFRRIQCTPDLLPTDVTGTNVFRQQAGEFEFQPGPIFAHVVLADELNRANPRTQAAFLEAMEERQVTIDGVIHRLPSPFFVLATQNPLEYQGTFPLPEAQRDRFLMQVDLGYPDPDSALQILERFRDADPLEELKPAATLDGLLRAQRQARTIYVDPDIQRYIISLVETSRELPELRLGASPRAMLLWQRAAQARAGLLGRAYVIPDDVVALAVPLLRHRLLLTSQAELRGNTAESVTENLVTSVKAPVES